MKVSGLLEVRLKFMHQQSMELGNLFKDAVMLEINDNPIIFLENDEEY